MRQLRTAATLATILLAAAATAAGCSKGGDKAGTAGGAKSGGPAASAGGGTGDTAKDDATGPVIRSDQLPVLKAGLWESTGAKADGTKDVEKTCHSGKPFKAMQMDKACSKLTIHRTLLGGFVIDAACGGNGMDMTMHMKATGDWTSHYAVDTTTTLKMPNQAPQTESEHKEARWVGACPAGMDVED